MDIKKSAVLDDYQKSVLSQIDDMFPGIGLLVSRGHSTPLEQLYLIGYYSQGFHYPEFTPQDVYKMVDVEYEGKSVNAYAWWRTWGESLHRGIIINPPLPAMAPYDYFKNGVIPCPIDFSQKINGSPDIERVNSCMIAAKASGVPISYVTIEHGNGCVHIGLLPQRKEV
jgi:hypothetical protein